jgi:hypothetical protein
LRAATPKGTEAALIVFDKAPEAGRVKTRLVPLLGEEGAAKRIDVLATAITAEMTVDDVIDLDLAYAPPFSGVWDAVHIAARKGAEALDKAAAARVR